ncbi:MmoB/DmpM family protein [Ottowia beijingensis]|uniref:MmoB/DmpM family protein n=1 Tax=Ottowia beijingensis TaxID=1207057 RepID=A0A853IZB3_9BURK|nr:MmoB/DmpM family protein [Ottowia beijingensis]NZA03287.1 MmoB/DmpM family protein [Ottowia beijingensis]NZA03406.1 MmoB/DmpM family protein [Ottowia beijingensis]NZA03448.1 MmoB/DmpM family protein [Ottowia beijingensis]
MTEPVSKVFIAFQDNEESRPIVDAILADNPEATAVHSPGLVKIDAPGRLVVRRESIEEQTGQRFDLQQIHVNLVTISGYINEDDDELSLSWLR